MKTRIRIALLAVSLAAGVHRQAAADVQVGVGIALPGVRIGINVPAYPDLVAIPGYPVYYAPDLDMNLFFYDGLYWVFVDDHWYSSSWYDGPWTLVEPDYVPYFILRVPILYYRVPPVYFRDWDHRRAPRWGRHWGHGWRERHRDWDRWNRSAAPPRAPLPTYQRRYSGPRYPALNEQRHLEDRFYRYRPRERHGFGPRASGQPPAGRYPMQPRPPERPQGQVPPPQARPQPTESQRRRPPIYRAPPQGPRPQAQQQRRGPENKADRREPPQPRPGDARPPRDR